MYEQIDGLYFFTATRLNRKPILSERTHKQIIIDGLNYFNDNGFCNFYGFVIMPNHLHLLMSTQDWKYFQHRFLTFTVQQILNSMKMKEHDLLNRMISTQKDRNYQIWERRPKWKSIITTDIFNQKLKYIHLNPLQDKWKLCPAPEEYEFSSAKSYYSGNPEFKFLKLFQ